MTTISLLRLCPALLTMLVLSESSSNIGDVPSRTLCNLSGSWTGAIGGHSAPLILVEQDGLLFKARAPCCWEGAEGIISSNGTTITGKGGWTHDNSTPWTLVVSSLETGKYGPCTKITTVTGFHADWCRHDLTPDACGAPITPAIDGCPAQTASRAIPAAAFGTIYPSTATKVGVSFNTTDVALQSLYDHAVSCEHGNQRDFLPGLANVVEGAGYGNVWLETQPMAGAMWAVRNVTQALANQLVFMRTQRDDGRLAGMVTTNYNDESLFSSQCGNANTTQLCAVYCIGKESLLQGDYFSTTAVDVAWFLNISDPETANTYITELQDVLARFDDWMWKNRRSTLPGYTEVLTCPSSADWGGDGYDGYAGYQAPFVSMDMMGYAHSNALALARMARLLGNTTGASHWEARSRAIQQALRASLWIDAKGACYDVDAMGKVVDVLVHNNLRAMWHGAFSQDMAETFVAQHLHNSSEFWTPFPLPSIAANDPRYIPGIPRNSWSGPAEGLTYQRAIRALENYGFHTEITLLGDKLVNAISVNGTFPQQWNPKPYQGVPAGAPNKGDCYGPALLSLLEYTAYAHGIKPRPADGALLWSSAQLTDTTVPPTASTYTQILGTNTWTLVRAVKNGTAVFDGRCNGDTVFTCTGGVRVVTTATVPATVVGVAGISPHPMPITLTLPTGHPDVDMRHPGVTVVRGVVEPNCEYALDGGGGLTLTRRVPFAMPGSPQ
eukprot:m.15751 g.15751  ORF g.15751 m.15751 type:complete len:725 (+) comp10816_c0_seq1:109-2283(+)